MSIDIGLCGLLVLGGAGIIGYHPDFCGKKLIGWVMLIAGIVLIVIQL
jgi:hypothetical protein